MTKVGVMFTSVTNEVYRYYLPYSITNVLIVLVLSILYYMFLMDYTATLAILAAPTFDAIMNKIADAIYVGYDHASTTGNGDILPGDAIGKLLLIP